MTTAEFAALPLLVCSCGWRYRVRCTNPLHWPRIDPRRLTLEIVERKNDT